MNNKLEQRKNEILQELENEQIFKIYGDVSFTKTSFRGGISNIFSFESDGICFQYFYPIPTKTLKLIIELYEVMQYLGEV